MRTSSKVGLLLAVRKTLCYYANFSHPLRLEEIHYNCCESCSLNELQQAVEHLVKLQQVHKLGDYYSNEKNMQNWINRRLKAEEMAKKVLPSAKNYARFISAFPFVRFVGISGSLSKGYADKNSDFDFFIICAKNRLWVSRSFLHLFKKLSFLFALQHKFCMNYFVDESHRKIEEQNPFTAIELKSLLPIVGKNQYKALMRENSWTEDFLPNGYMAYFTNKHPSESVNLFKSIAEVVLHPFGTQLNLFFMKLTDKKWRKKWKKRNYPEEDYDLAFKTTLHQSKNHPGNYQKKILQKLEKL